LKKIENSSSRFSAMATQRLRVGSGVGRADARGIPPIFQPANGSGHRVCGLYGCLALAAKWPRREQGERESAKRERQQLIKIETGHIKIKWLLLPLMNFPLARTRWHTLAQNMATIYPLRLALSLARVYVPLARTATTPLLFWVSSLVSSIALLSSN